MLMACVCVCGLAASPDATQPVEALLDVAAYPDQAISAISFNFWHHLMRRLTLPEHSAHVRRDVEIITSHCQDTAANTRSYGLCVDGQDGVTHTGLHCSATLLY